MSVFHNNKFEYNQGYNDAVKFGSYDYSRPHGPEYDAGFMSGYFQKYGYTYDGKTYTQMQNERNAQEYQNNIMYARSLLRNVNPFTIKSAALLKSILAVIIFLIIFLISSILGNHKSTYENKYENKRPKYDATKFNSDYIPAEWENAQAKTDEVKEADFTSEGIEKNYDKAPDFTAYIKETKDNIKKNWTPPETDLDTLVEVKFKISKNGDLLSYEIIRSSGINEADEAAIAAIEAAAPFGSLPGEFKGQSISIKVTFNWHNKNK